MTTEVATPGAKTAASAPPRAEGEPAVVFFDGECGLCDQTVQWLMKRDRRRVLRYAPLQGDTAREVVGELPADRAQWTMMLWDQQGLAGRSTGALRTLRKLGGLYGVLATLGLWTPRFLRDAVYRYVARNRLRWFPKGDACRIPTPEERSLLLP